MLVMPDTPMAVARCVLPVPGPPTSTDVVCVVGEGHWWPVAHQLAIDRRDLEVEAGQVAVHRELRHVHLVADRAHGAIRALGLQQVLDQPARGLHALRSTLLDQIGPGAGHAVQAQRLEFDQHVRRMAGLLGGVIGIRPRRRS
jgi:hypothetical protein